MRILVVEDEADLNLLLCKVLTKAGYTVDRVPGRRGRPGLTCWARHTMGFCWM